VTDRTEIPAGNSPAGLIGDVIAGLSRLVQGEIALAKAEATRSLQDVMQAAVRLVLAAILGMVALNVLAGAAIAALIAAGMTALWASLAVGGLVLLIAGGLAQAAMSRLRAAGRAPRQALKSLRRDVETFKSMVTSHGSTH
jgi:Putative Actinobacterial Holin-X, holin superfamily III